VEDPYGLAVGLMFVMVYAINRFNTPATNRWSTTSLRYHSSLVLYVSTSFVLLFFIAQLVQMSPELVGISLPSAAKQALRNAVVGGTPAEGFSYFLFSALCLTILLSKVPGLRAVDGATMQVFQKFGAIPYQLDRLSKDLSNADFRLPERHVAAFEAAARRHGLDAERFREAFGPSLEAVWVQAFSLYASLKEFEQEPRCARLFDDFQKRWRTLERRLERFNDEAIGILRVDASKISGDADPPDGAVETALDAYRDLLETEAWAPTEGRDYPLWSYLFGGGTLGFIIGYFVPAWYRADNGIDPEQDGAVEGRFVAKPADV
jgi:hypothetical protein